MSVRFGRVDIFASGTVEFDCFLVGDVGKTDGKEGLGVTVDSGTTAKVGFAVFLQLRD
jgi:hypothetical protein